MSRGYFNMKGPWGDKMALCLVKIALFTAGCKGYMTIKKTSLVLSRVHPSTSDKIASQ